MAGVKELRGMVGRVQSASDAKTKRSDEKKSMTCSAVIVEGSAVKPKVSGPVKKSRPQIILDDKENVEHNHVQVRVEQLEQTKHTFQKKMRVSLSNVKDPVIHNITTSSITTDQKIILLAAVKDIPGAVLMSDLTMHCNLLVINASTTNTHYLAPRTIKYMLAILRHVPIVSFEWVMECITIGRWIEYEQYLIDGDEVCGQVTNASRKSLQDDMLLFDSLQFYLSPNIQQAGGPNRQDIVSVIEAGGGTIITAGCEGCIYLVNGLARRRTTGPGSVMTVAELFMHVSRYERPCLAG